MKKISIALSALLMMVCLSLSITALANEPQVPVRLNSSNSVVTLSSDNYYYSGGKRTPGVYVTYTDSLGNEKKLLKNRDYIFEYKNNINVGYATVSIKGIGNYSGALSKKFKINPMPITSSHIEKTLGYTKCEFSGNSRTPYIKLVWNNNGKKINLVKDRDFTVTYSNNRNVGRATVKVVGKGNYGGSFTKYFDIMPQKVKGLKVTGTSTTTISLSWSKQSYISGYCLYKYDTSSKQYKYFKTVSASDSKVTLTGYDPATSHYFKIRSYVNVSNSKKYYGEYSDFVVTATTPKRITLNSVTKKGKSISVEWTPVRSSGYQIFYSTDSSFKKSVKCITIKNSKAKSYKITNINSSATYYVKVRAYYVYKNVTYKGLCSTPLSTYYSNLYSSYYSYYVNDANRTNNLKIASKAISGTIVQPGQTFSFNNVVGPRTSAKGYKPAGIFSGGGVVNGIGGGICQVASTMFNCALYANVGIVERHQHSQRVAYVPLGRDAAIYGTAEDLKWKNTTKYPIRIEMTVKDGIITCSFYTSVKVKPPKVSLNVKQNGNSFTLKRTVGGKVNYSCYSKY